MFKAKDILNYILNTASHIKRSKYFYPSVILIGFTLASFAVLYVGSAPFLSQLKEGDISLRAVYSPYDFTYPTSVDEEKTEEARREFEAKILPVYDIDVAVQEMAFARVDDFFDKAEEVQQGSMSDEERIDILKKEGGFSALSEKELTKFVEAEDLARMKKIAKDALENIFLVGVVEAKAKKELISKGIEKVSVRNARLKIEREVEVKDIVDEKEAQRVVLDTLERLDADDKAAKQLIYNLIKVEVASNARFNEDYTSGRKEEARAEVLPIYRRGTVKKNELIVEKGKRLTKDDIAKLTQITRIHSVVNRTSYLSGLFMLLVGLILIGSIYLLLFEKRLIQEPKNVLLIGINAFVTILISLVIVKYQQSLYLIPLASIGMILVLLLNVNAAFVTSLVLSVYIGIMAGGKLNVSLVLFMGSAVGIFAVRGARRRSQIFFASFIISVMNIAAISGIGLLNNLEKEAILIESLFGVTNGIISGFIVIGLLPVFEYIFNFITNITLLELSDLSHPLLKELTIKAPGTYHHSILVGNLAEEACNAIGANSLLARVGAYYHDIGKIEKAEYFVENEMGTASKHDRLAPSMSALIITSHTKDGIELAKKHNINRAIKDFIEQHHGTGLIYYFYQRALEKVKSEEELEEEEFRYPGPKPQAKETAVVLLADSVEASSRMLSDPTPARIRGLVQKIINNKFIDGQLDECDLTLKDLHKIAESFVRVLTGVFHTRLEYPDIKPKKEKKNAHKNKDKQSQ